MADYKATTIRNIALMGHGGEGKTTLTEAMLFAAGVIDRQGRVEDGNTVSDYDPEEIRRGISINASVIPIDYNGLMFNVIDIPGYFDFIGEIMGPLRVVESAIFVVSAVGGTAVGTEKAMQRAIKHEVSKFFCINQMDREHADFYKVLQQLRDLYGTGVCPVLLPIGDAASFSGVVNVLENKAYTGVGKGRKEIPVPADMGAKIKEAYDAIMEAAAGAEDDLMEKYFEAGELEHDEILRGFRSGVLNGSVIPVAACSAITGIGVGSLMDVMHAYLPSPVGEEHFGVNPNTGSEEKRLCENDQPFSAFVFKTLADPFVGKLSLFKVRSGIIKSDSTILNANTGKTFKVSGLYVLRGKKQINVPQLQAGDIGALSKLSDTLTSHTLCDPNAPIQYDPIGFPAPAISKAVYAKKQGEEDKVFSGLNKLCEEDPSISIKKNTQTTETLLSGQGEMHLDVIQNKLLNKYGAACVLQDPKIPYRETIRKAVKVQGRHKKQTGGHGQYGDVWIEFSPVDQSIDFEFEDAVVGGVVPRNFIPSVEKGLRENIVKGVLAGYPMVGLHAKLYDGSYHPVDSSEMAFKTAARIAYKKGCMDASPVLLEPIMNVKVEVPDEYMGDIMGDINKRRGRIIGMNQEEGMQHVLAEVPQSEMMKYATDLRSLTQARGSFTMEFLRYEDVPAAVAQKIIDSAVKDDSDDDE